MASLQFRQTECPNGLLGDACWEGGEEGLGQHHKEHRGAGGCYNGVGPLRLAPHVSLCGTCHGSPLLHVFRKRVKGEKSQAFGKGACGWEG